ncbi:MAG: glutathione S-transferase family protein [Minwuia sp.]|uniref:glutathione S-transferase family protein n=1 Tax=Minwuia sp. TaxID=2493630 RepID=UPI003A89BFD7
MTELWQFRFSPYNEKARWALALKGIPYTPRTVLPGPHMRTIRKLSGQQKTPVLVMDGIVTPNSADIVARLETAFPDPPLMPGDAEGRERVLEIQRLFDDGFGPRIRRAVLDSMLGSPGYVATVFAGDRGWLQRTVYRATLPLAAGLIRRGNGIGGAADVADGIAAITDAMDFVSANTAATGYLVGDRFTLADMAAAATLATVVNPDHPAMKRPEPMPSATRALIERHAGHPAAGWVRRIYAAHRPLP